MPATRTINGETRMWDEGSRTWTPMPDASAVAGYHPDVADSDHPWLARLKGFFSGASEATTPTKVGTLAALAIPGAAPAALTAGGVMALADMLKTHFGTANAPQSFGDAALDVGGAAFGAGIKGPVGKGVELASKVVKNPRALSGGLGATVGGYEGYKRGGVVGALEGAVLGGVAGQTALGRRLAGVTEALTPGAETALGDADAAAAADAYLKRMPRSTEVPGSSYREPVSSPRFTPDTVPGQSDFNEMPLSRQMDHLPAGGTNPVGTRTGPPPYQAPSAPPTDPAMNPRVSPGGKSPDLMDTFQNAIDGLRGDTGAITAESGRLPDTPSARTVDRGNMPPRGNPSAREPLSLDAILPSKSSFPWPEAGGQFEADAIGSHKLVAPTTEPTAVEAPGTDTLSPTHRGEFQELSTEPASIAALDYPEDPDVMPKAFSDAVEELANEERIAGFPNTPAKWSSRVPKSQRLRWAANPSDARELSRDEINALISHSGGR